MEHADVPTGFIHLPFNWVYANAAARTAQTGLTSGDVNKIALQTDTGAIWRVASVDGSGNPTWAAATSTGTIPTLDTVPAPTADVSMNSHKLINVADATNPTDGLNQRAGDARYLQSATIGGALTATYGRTSTLSAPSLRDIVSIIDFAATTNGDGTVDDSTVVSAMVTALKNAGGGLGVFTPHRKDGSQATWTFQRVSIVAANFVTLTAYGARMQCVSANAGGSMFKGDGSSSSPGTYLTSGFQFFGGIVLGKNIELLNQSVIQLDRAQDTVIRDLYAKNFGSAVIYMIDSARTRIEDVTAPGCCKSVAANPINVTTQSTFSGTSVLMENLVITGCVIEDCPSAPIAVSYGSVSNHTTLAIQLSLTVTGGTFTLSFTWNGVTYTTAAIASNATAATVQTAIQGALGPSGETLPASALVAYGGALPTKVYLVFQGTMTGMITGLSSNSSLTGTGIVVSFTYPPLRLVVTNNNCESTGWTPFVMEIGGTSAGNQAVILQHEALVAHNVFRYTGPNNAAAYGAAFTNDSSTLLAQPELFSHVLVLSNRIASHRNGIQIMGSNFDVADNQITAGNQGIIVQPPTGGSSNPVTHVNITGGSIRMSSINSAGSGVSLTSANDCTVDVPDITWDTGGVNGGGEGVILSSCLRVSVRAKINNAPLRGIRISGSSGAIHIEPGTRIYNPSSKTATNTAGIRIDATLVGDVTIDGTSVRDDRGGSAQMNYAVDTSPATLGSFGVYERLGRLIGWTTAALNGTFTLKGLNDVWDTTGVVYTAGKRITWGTAAPSSGTWGQGDVCWNQTPTATGAAFWMNTTAGTPGTWTACNLGASGSSTQPGPVKYVSANATLALTDMGAKVVTGGITLKLPASLASAAGNWSVTIKNTSSGSITVNGNGATIDAYTPNGLNDVNDVVAAGDSRTYYLDVDSSGAPTGNVLSA